MKHLVIFGAPGSGKGTQSKKIEEKFGYTALSTGDLLRAEVASGSEIGKSCAAIMAEGKFPDNKIIFQLIEKFFAGNQHQTGVLYDGFPRTIDQAEFLLGTIHRQNEKIDCVINVNVDEDALVKRITGRFSCAGCGEIYNRHFKMPKTDGVCDACGGVEFKTRADDTEDTVKTRLMVYREATAPILDFFIKHGLKIDVVDGMAPVEDVFRQIENILNIE